MSITIGGYHPTPAIKSICDSMYHKEEAELRRQEAKAIRRGLHLPEENAQRYKIYRVFCFFQDPLRVLFG
jgi:hypothetical protein